ncbi:MAG TPA: molybdopterin-binding protein [Streptosporangiaceae bacterium]
MADDPSISDVPPHALDAWRDARVAAGTRTRVQAVRVRLQDAAGLVTAEPVWATRSSPPFDAAGMDGIAVCAASAAGASETAPVLLEPNAFDVVDTGDPMPEGRDAVVMREHVRYVGQAAELRAAARPGQHVREAGEDIGAAELLLPEGHRLRAVDLAAAAAAGATQLLVRRAPVVAVLPARDEMRHPPAPCRDLEASVLMLAGQAREAGCDARCLPTEPGDQAGLANAVIAAAASCDLLIVVTRSVGGDDPIAKTLAQLGNLAWTGGVGRPGHQVLLGVVGSTPVLATPGDPAAAALMFDLLAVSLLAELQGVPPGSGS